MGSYYTAYQTVGLSLPPPPEGLQDWHQTIGLSAQNPDYVIDGSVKKVAMGLGWDAGCDVDGSVAVFDQQLRLLDTIWWKQLRSRDGSIKHSGDDTTGEGGGDDEVIKVKLSKLHPSAHHVMFVVCVYTGGMTFSQVRSAYVRMLHGNKKHKGHVLAKYNLTHMKGNAMLMGLLSRRGAYWNFRALGVPVSGRTVVDVIHDPVTASCLSASPSFPPLVRRIYISVKEGRNLAIKDKNFFGSGGSSDPYVDVAYQKKRTKSAVIKKNLNPVWNLPAMDLGNVIESENKAVKITVWDYDITSDDFMGVIRIPAASLHKAGPGTHSWWMPLTISKDPGHATSNVKGEVKVEVTVQDVPQA